MESSISMITKFSKVLMYGLVIFLIMGFAMNSWKEYCMTIESTNMSPKDAGVCGTDAIKDLSSTSVAFYTLSFICGALLLIAAIGNEYIKMPSKGSFF